MWGPEGQGRAGQGCGLRVALGPQCTCGATQVVASLLRSVDVCFSFLCPQIREQNLQDIKTAGPQSQVLCGVVMDRSLVQVRAQSI